MAVSCPTRSITAGYHLTLHWRQGCKRAKTGLDGLTTVAILAAARQNSSRRQIRPSTMILGFKRTITAAERAA